MAQATPAPPMHASACCTILSLAIPGVQVVRGPDDAPLQFNVRHQPLVMRKAENLEPQRFDTSAE